MDIQDLKIGDKVYYSPVIGERPTDKTEYTIRKIEPEPNIFGCAVAWLEERVVCVALESLTPVKADDSYSQPSAEKAEQHPREPYTQEHINRVQKAIIGPIRSTSRVLSAQALVDYCYQSMEAHRQMMVWRLSSDALEVIKRLRDDAGQYLYRQKSGEKADRLMGFRFEVVEGKCVCELVMEVPSMAQDIERALIAGHMAGQHNDGEGVDPSYSNALAWAMAKRCGLPPRF